MKKVLVVFSDPTDESTRLRSDKEDRTLCELAKQFKDRVSLERQHASELDDIHALLIDGSYHVIHFSGHGDPNGILLEKGDVQGGELVSAERLVHLLNLAKRPPLLVLILACFSDSSRSILCQAAPFVITADSEIDDQLCIAFGRAFYEHFLRGDPVEVSFKNAQRRLASKGLGINQFHLSRRTLVQKGDSVFVQSEPSRERDSILINLDSVKETLGSVGMSREELLHLLARKLTIHSWIFDRARDQAVIPIGQLLFGTFEWEDCNDVVYCTRLARLAADAPKEQWAVWVHLLTSYNDLASSEYRTMATPAGPGSAVCLSQAVHLFDVHLIKWLLPKKPEIERLGFKNLIPHIEFVAAEVDNAKDQLDLERYPQVVVALEGALTNYHEVVTGMQPPEEKKQV